MSAPQTTVLVILDGWGIENPKKKGNPITPETAPFYFSLLKKNAYAELEASGTAVGLFKGQEGNSEAGHLNIGAGRVVKQDALYISEAIEDRTFFKNVALLQVSKHAKKTGGAVHLTGLLSNHNSAHSTPEHLYALLDFFRGQGIKKVFLHLFTDGRDSGQHDALQHLKKLQAHFRNGEQIATIMGRLYGMDRNKNWGRTKKAFEALTEGVGRKAATPEDAITIAYNSDETDEFISPTIITHKDKPIALIEENDVVIFFNLRSDRTRQLTKTFVQPNFERMNQDTFKRKKVFKHLQFVAMTDFGPDLANILTAFPSRDVQNSLVQVMCPRRQLYISESEKFAHITYFLNGGYAQHFCDEQWVKIASGDIEDFELDPDMKAEEIANYVVKAIEKNHFEFIAINLANADMVGHTGNFAAAEKAITAIDAALMRIVSAMTAAGSVGVVTADHGNVEEMINAKTGETDTEHSTNPVPCIIIGTKHDYQAWKVRPGKLKKTGKLADVAPTILKMMRIKQPKEMTGKSLIA